MKIKITLFLLTALLLCGKDIHAAEYGNATLENKTLDGENVFSGKVFIKGRVTISAGSSLLIQPGTELIFVFLDEDGDGIGESEILSQGSVTVKGTKESPVRFYSDRRRKGAWLGVSIMNVDTDNIFEHAVFEDSYMALHSHFSNLTVKDCVFKNNMRGFQSQEGSINLINNEFFENNSGVQFRNSKAFVKRNNIYRNEGGMNFLYSAVAMEDTRIDDNRLFGLKIRFSKALIKGLSVSKSLQNIYGKASEIEMENVTTEDSMLRGFSFENSVIKIKNSLSANNMLDGISLDTSKAECENFSLQNNARYQIYLKGKGGISGSYTMSGTKQGVFNE